MGRGIIFRYFVYSVVSGPTIDALKMLGNLYKKKIAQAIRSSGVAKFEILTVSGVYSQISTPINVKRECVVWVICPLP